MHFRSLFYLLLDLSNIRRNVFYVSLTWRKVFISSVVKQFLRLLPYFGLILVLLKLTSNPSHESNELLLKYETCSKKIGQKYVMKINYTYLERGEDISTVGTPFSIVRE
jgi:hypothetical protein